MWVGMLRGQVPYSRIAGHGVGLQCINSPGLWSLLKNKQKGVVVGDSAVLERLSV